MNWKEFGRKQCSLILRYHPGIGLKGLRKTTKISVRIVGLRTEISTRDVPHRKERFPLDHDIR
jgi:hypothetical protein